MIVDTRIVRSLTDNGVPETQAIAIAGAIAEAIQRRDEAQAATRADLLKVKSDLLVLWFVGTQIGMAVLTIALVVRLLWR
jgi:hypothetical protein